MSVNEPQDTPQKIRLLLNDLSRAAGRLERLKIIHDLISIDSPVIFDILVNLLETAQGEERCAIINELSHNTEKALPILIGELTNPDRLVRWVASGLMTNIRDTRTVPVLIECLLQDSEIDVRINVAIALEEIGDPRALPALIIAMEKDQEYNSQGHSVSFPAACAIQEIKEHKNLHD